MNGLKAMEMDRRISDLPQPILHHILSFLSQKDAVKTSVLSKPWRYLWYGRTNVEFCFDHFKGNTEKFMSVLDQTLIRYENQNLSIQKFILNMSTVDEVSAPYLAKRISIVLWKKGMELFHLSFDYKLHDYAKPEACFDLPSVVFESESLREIYLKGCELNQISCTDKVFFRHLRKLRLHFVKIAEETFERIMSSCPLIEEVSLKKCMGLDTINVNSLYCSLKIFMFKSYFTSGARIVFTNVLFSHLKSLKLSRVGLATKLFESFSCNFPCVEELELRHCFDGFEEFRLSSRSIKRLAIEVEHTIFKVSIDAPNLVQFEYRGETHFPVHISFATTSNKWKSNVVMRPRIDCFNEIENSLWSHKLDEFIKALSPSEVFVHVVHVVS